MIGNVNHHGDTCNTTLVESRIRDTNWQAPQHEGERQCWLRFLAVSLIFLTAVFAILVTSFILTESTSVDPKTGKVVEYSCHYFIYCLIGGVISGLAHLVLTPVDLIKCRVQVGEYQSMIEGFQKVYREKAHSSWRSSLRLFFHGWVPTFLGYCLQGGLKFGCYEVFKYLLIRPHLLHSATEKATDASQLFAFLGASMLAEIVADIGLAPWEAVKIIVQTTDLPSELHILIPKIYAVEGIYGFYKSLVLIWCRQVPCTMMKFAIFEKVSGLLKRHFVNPGCGATSPHASGTTYLFISITAGIFAGFLCAIISHPADTIVSKLNQRGRRLESSKEITVADDEGPPGTLAGTVVATGSVSSTVQRRGKSVCPTQTTLSSFTEVMSLTLSSCFSTFAVVRSLIAELGWRGLWRGLGARVIMVSTLTAIQWLAYDSFKVLVGLPTTGGYTARKHH